MDVLVRLWDAFWVYFHQGLPHLNFVQGIVIAIVGGLMVRSIASLFAVAFLAVIVHILADALIPTVMASAPFVLPPLNAAFLHYVVTLYIAYLVVIGVIYVIKEIFSAVRG